MLNKFSDFFSPKKLELLAKKTKFQKRTPKKITAYNFILSFFNVYCARNYSMRNWAQELSLICGKMVSHQALEKKLTIRHLPFLKEVFAHIISKNLTSIKQVSDKTLVLFNRILIEDSTCVKLSDAMYQHFSGASNGKTVKPIARLQVCLDLLQSKFENVQMTSYSKNDIAFSHQIVDRIKSKDLIIRDLGYWVVDVLCSIHYKGAYFISRLKNRVKIIDLSGETFDLVKNLKGLDKQNKTEFSFIGQLNTKREMKVKIVAFKVCKAQHLHRIKQAKKSRHKKSKMSAETKYLLSWEIYVTNLINDELPNDEIRDLYQLRWEIEMFFKN